MRILHWLTQFPPAFGGLETLVVALIDEQIGAGHQVTAITAHPRSDATEPVTEQHKGATVHRIPYIGQVRDRDLAGILRARTRAAKLVAEIAPDVHHIHMVGPISFLADGPITRRQAASVFTMHSTLYDALNKGGTAFERLLRAADRVTAVSAPTLAELCGGYPFVTDKAAVLLNGLPGERPPFPLADADAVPRLVALGRAVPEKGFDTFFAALALLKESGREFTASLAGDGPDLRALIGLAGRLGLPVDFPGILDAEQVATLYRSAAVVVMPSRWEEPFGLVALEAQLAGRPVVACRVGGIPSFVTDGETGLLVPKDDPPAMAAAIARVLDDPELTRRLVAAARPSALERFSMTRCAREYEATYRDAIAAFSERRS
jgi:glycogen(starch) synthase